MRPTHRCFYFAVLIPALTACAADPPPPAATTHATGRFEPAPMPFVHYTPRDGTVGMLEIPIPPKMPPGTGAVPVSSSPFRGSIVTGLKESF
jgi:hypothetical protein